MILAYRYVHAPSSLICKEDVKLVAAGKRFTQTPRLLYLLFFYFTLVSSLNITIYQSNVPFTPSPLPPSHADSDGEHIVSLFQDLGRTTIWKSIDNITFEGDTYEPEGMVRLGPDRYIISAGEYTASTVPYNKTINGTDRSAGAGFAHLIVFSGNGSRIADATITRQGAVEYHNGGIDFDGEYIWGSIAQYRPNSTAYVYKTPPDTLVPETVVHYDDHLGGVVHDVRANKITALNWGSRNATTFELQTGSTTKVPFATADKVVRNPSYFIDYQDCKFLGHSKHYNYRAVMLCGGVATLGSGTSEYNLGGIAIVDVETMVPLAEVPITLRSTLGVPLTQNPIEASVHEGKLRLYFLPDEHKATLYVVEAQPDSLYEF